MKTKHKGRIDQNDTWADIRDRWIELYRNREVHAGESVQVRVTAADEWCAEAYMETDYSTLGNVNRKLTICDNPILTTPER